MTATAAIRGETGAAIRRRRTASVAGPMGTSIVPALERTRPRRDGDIVRPARLAASTMTAEMTGLAMVVATVATTGAALAAAVRGEAAASRPRRS